MASTKHLLNRIKRQSPQVKTPIASDMFIPNHSGDHSAGEVLTTPTQDLDIVNKKYVDDEIDYKMEDGNGNGQMVFWGRGLWIHTETNELMWDDVNKRLGIGTSTPTEELEVDGTIRGKKVNSVGATNVNANVGMYTYSVISSRGGEMVFKRSKGSETSPLNVASGNSLGTMKFDGYFGGAYIPAAEILVSVDGAPSGTTVPGRMRFRINVAGTMTDALTMKASGNIGIGVLDPHSKLEVNGAISSATSTFSTTGPTDNVAVGGVNTLFVNTASNNVTIGGFAGGVAGQKLCIIKTSSSNILTIEHLEGGGSQDIYTHDGADETVGIGKWGGFNFVCDGTNWWDIQHK